MYTYTYICGYIYAQRQLFNYCMLYILECNVYQGDTGLGCGVSKYNLQIFDNANSTLNVLLLYEPRKGFACVMSR